MTSVTRTRLFSPTVFSGGRNTQIAAARNLDTLIGFIGFFAVLSFGWTAYVEISGDDAVLEAIILLSLVLVLAGLWRIRRRLN